MYLYGTVFLHGDGAGGVDHKLATTSHCECSVETHTESARVNETGNFSRFALKLSKKEVEMRE